MDPHSLSATLDLQSDDSLKLYGGPLFDAVAEPFTIFRSTLVRPERYRADLVGLALTSKTGRRLSGQATLEAAGFYGGTRRTVVSRAQWKVSRHATATLDYSSSWVRMPETRFRAEVVQACLDAARDTRLSGRILLQYDNASQDLGLNMRLNYLLREGTELAFVFGRRDERSPEAAARLQFGRTDSIALLKLTWLLNF